MKKVTLVIFLIIVLKVNGQDIITEEVLISQREWFDSAEKALKNSNELSALRLYHFVYSSYFGCDIESISKRKIDSLLPLVQEKEMKKYKGKWKLKKYVDRFYYDTTIYENGTWKFKQLDTTKYDYEYIIISDNEISFYTKNNLNVPSRIEKIKFAEYHPREFFISTSSIIFNNNEIWEFTTKKVNQEVRLFPDMKTNANGKGHGFLLDERSMIIDSVQREKALAKEITTYYVLVE